MQNASDRSRLSQWRRVVDTGLWFAALLAVWQSFVAFGHVSDLILPAPSGIPDAHRHQRRPHLSRRRCRPRGLVILGFLAGALPAVPLGFLIVSSTLMQRTLYPFLVFLNVVPKIALVPLLLVWFGFGGVPKVIVAALLVFFPDDGGHDHRLSVA